MRALSLFQVGQKEHFGMRFEVHIVPGLDNLLSLGVIFFSVGDVQGMNVMIRELRGYF